MKYVFRLERSIFRKFPVQAKLSFSPYACCLHARGGRGTESLSIFLRLAALCMVLLRRFKILLGVCLEGIHFETIYGIVQIRRD